MNFIRWIKKNPKKTALIVTGLVATASGAGFMILLRVREGVLYCMGPRLSARPIYNMTRH